MKFSPVVAALLLVTSLSVSQIKLDYRILSGIDSTGKSTGLPNNKWSPTLEQMEIVYFVAWQDQLKDTVFSLRPGNFWEILVDGRPFRGTLLNVQKTGTFANSQHSYWRMTYDTYTVDKRYLSDTTCSVLLNLGNSSINLFNAVRESTIIGVNFDMSRYVMADSVTLGLRVYDADFPTEGSLYINNNGPITLFGPVYGGSAGNNIYLNTQFKTPARWWISGTNALKFVHETTQGFRIDTLSRSIAISVHVPKGGWVKTPTVWSDTTHMPFTNWGLADRCGQVKYPSDSLRYGFNFKYYFEWDLHKGGNPDSAVVDSVHEVVDFSPDWISGLTSTGNQGPNTQVRVRVAHHDIPRTFLPPPSAQGSPGVMSWRFKIDSYYAKVENP